MITADWYFDFVSPFSYLQLADFHQLNSMAHVNLRPVVLGGILQDMGTRGPAEIPPAHPFNPLKALRLAVALKCQPEAVATIFSHIWKDGRSLESAEDWQSLCAQLSVTDADTKIAAQWVKDELRDNGVRARAAGLFGVPSLVISGEVFWGADSTELVLDYLQNPLRFSAGEYQRLNDLPVGVTRRQV